MIGVDAILGDAELQEGLALGGQVLAVGGTTAYPMRVPVMGQVYGYVPHPQLSPYHSYETLLVPI